MEAGEVASKNHSLLPLQDVDLRDHQFRRHTIDGSSDTAKLKQKNLKFQGTTKMVTTLSEYVGLSQFYLNFFISINWVVKLT